VNGYVRTGPVNVTIGVCGEQGSGKTIFLTCIFQSIWTAFSDDVVFDFDRAEIGNADYFRDIEDRLMRGEKTAGTGAQSMHSARIHITSNEPAPSPLPPTMEVDIHDFAGGHFRSLANLKELGSAREVDADDTKTLRAVDATIRKADALVILINATEIDPLNETPRRNPFSPSVNYLLSYCRTEKKPVALLFSQVDQTPLLTDDIFRSMPRVQAFERHFTSDHAEAAQGRRPFGIVQTISCYETVEGDVVPIRQTMDGSIWRREPAQVVRDLLYAATPRIYARMHNVADQELKRKAQERRDAAAKSARRLVLGAATLIFLLLIIALSLLARGGQSESGTLQRLRESDSRMATGAWTAVPDRDATNAGRASSTLPPDAGAPFLKDWLAPATPRSSVIPERSQIDPFPPSMELRHVA